MLLENRHFKVRILSGMANICFESGCVFFLSDYGMAIMKDGYHVLDDTLN